MKTKNREVDPTRRQAAVHTGMKALGFSESAPLAGILSSPHSLDSHTITKATPEAQVTCFFSRTQLFINLRALEDQNHSQKKEEKERKRKPGSQSLQAALLTPASRPAVRLSRQAAAHRCRLWFILKVELLLMNDVERYYTTLRPPAVI